MNKRRYDNSENIFNVLINNFESASGISFKTINQVSSLKKNDKKK